jgi:hypothetical protein
MTEPRAAEIRYRVDPADVPAEKAARRLHLTLERFNEVLPNLRRLHLEGDFNVRHLIIGHCR